VRPSSGSPPSSRVSVITSAIPSRLDLLEECKASVAAQTLPALEHLIHIDEEGRGAAWVVNHLAEQARGEWLLPLADDDFLTPGCIATLLARSEGADVVYAPPLLWGNAETHFFGDPPKIPATALIRTSLWHELGGYEQGIVREEDRSFWIKAMNHGAVFTRTDAAPTWIYRFHGNGSGHQNKSYHGGHAL
jgi:glycosyltransferase involved in cell wall biosynthesis